MTTIERPILFSAPMVQAILRGDKTQTRRVIKPQPPSGCAYTINGSQSDALCFAMRGEAYIYDSETIWVPPTPKSKDHLLPSPYGKPGDRLWVRETWAAPHQYDHLPPRLIPADARFHYLATEEKGGLLWRPSIHMSRVASRITLEITDVRAQRIQEISEADSIAEGIEPDGDGWKSYEVIFDGPHKGKPHPHAVVPNRSPVTSSKELWDSINKARGFGWSENPWVWCLTFKRIEVGE